jgi:predicted nucleic acid-binding protein
MEHSSALVDTNILLRLLNPQVPGHRVCARAVDRLRDLGYTLCFTLQNATEFRNVSTRPIERNGHGMSLQATDLALDWIEGAMILLADEQGVYEEWRRLVTLHGVSGVQVHDARLAASMIVHDVPQILTLNLADFARFQGIRAVHPASLLQ